ncbi:MAG: ATP-dependent DNA helicase RecG [Parvularculaceae bacterium]
MRPAVLNPLFAEITVLPGVGPKVAAMIEKVAGPHVGDLALTLPANLIDRSAHPKLAEAEVGRLVTVEVGVDRHTPGEAGRPYRVVCSDETGYLTLVFFHPRVDYLRRVLPEGKRRIVSGRIEDYRGARQMTHPDHIVDPERAEDLPLFEPVYPLTAGLSAAVMRKAVSAAVARAPDLSEWQDAAWLSLRGWKDWKAALETAHRPETANDLSPQAPARQRLAYDELLANQLALALIRRTRARAKGRAIKGEGAMCAKAKTALPFDLTRAQKAAIKEIFENMESTDRMVRLLQGDVGSGKTVVALFAMLNAVETGAQAALMAPTEILARQHYETLAPLCAAAGATIDILTGRDKAAQRTEKLARLASGDTDILIGTHALFQETVAFRDLAFVVVDEQHRFGVHQRMALAAKGPRPACAAEAASARRRPDMLVMTATPIPRTLALTAYGDMEATVIAEKPPGRKPVDTRAIPLERIDEVVAAVNRAAGRGEQIYWVCPLVEESEALSLTAAEERYESLKAVFGDRVGLVHGRMGSAEKDAVMEAFHQGGLSVLIATTVIEVGVNAPNATVMVIEHAERFGLAQLHQLRGRVGRSDLAAACLLLYKGPLGETAKARIEILRETEDGFRIAEEDLRLRGAGDLLGAAQSGFPRFRIADLAAHADLLAAARDDARLIIKRDPELGSARGAALRTLLYLFGRDDAVKLLQAG